MSGRTPQQTLQQIVDIASGLSSIIKMNREHALSSDTDNGKYMRHYNQAEAIAATGAHTKNINQLCEKLGITYQDGQRWRISLADVQAIRVELGHKPFERSASQELQIMTISSLKGGAGKTTTAATTAVGMSTECLTRYRVAFIDLDPQATGTAQIKPNADDTVISAGDLLSGNIELDEGETFEQACRAAFCETNIPNLRILPAKDSDREYEVLAEQRKAEGGYIAYKDLQRIIDAVADDFDIIIIDTAPQFSTATLAAHYVANNLIIPIRPAENDRDASEKYITYLATMYRLLAGMGHQGYDSLHVLIAGVHNNSSSHRDQALEIRSVINKYCFATETPDSEAVRTCAKQYCTVFDMSVSEYVHLGSRNTIKLAQQEFGKFIDEIEQQLLRNWGVK